MKKPKPVSFKLLNMRSSYVFKLFEEDWEKGKHWGWTHANRTLEHAVAVASSAPIYFSNPEEPLRVRTIVLSSDPLIVKVMWSSGGHIANMYYGAHKPFMVYGPVDSPVCGIGCIYISLSLSLSLSFLLLSRWSYTLIIIIILNIIIFTIIIIIIIRYITTPLQHPLPTTTKAISARSRQQHTASMTRAWSTQLSSRKRNTMSVCTTKSVTECSCPNNTH